MWLATLEKQFCVQCCQQLFVLLTAATICMASKGCYCCSCCCCGCCCCCSCCGYCCIIYSVKDQKQGAAEAKTAKTTTKVSATCCSARLLGGLPPFLPHLFCLLCSELQVQLLPLLLSIFGEGKCCYCVAHTQTHTHTVAHLLTHMQLIIAYSASYSSGRLSFCCPSLGTPSSCFLYALSFLRHHRRQCLSVSLPLCMCVCVIGEWHVATQVGSQLCLGWLPRLNSRFHWPKPEHSISTDHTQSAPKLPPQSQSQPQLKLAETEAEASFMQPAPLCLCFASSKR